ncbi:MAG: ATP-binding cassette domain-containing protein [Myxococcota bacterium]
MHFHAEHSLFFESRRPLWAAALAFGLAVSVLIVNAAARSSTFSFLAGVIGLVLLVSARARRKSRVKPALAWIVGLVLVAMLSQVVLQLDTNTLLEATLRVLCGVIWVLWLGSQVDWASMRQLLRRVGTPDFVVASLDHAVMHGVFTQREWVQRRDAARLRIGSRHLPLTAWGPLLGEGALHAFGRLESAEENGLLRAAPRTDSGAQGGVALDEVSVERGGQTVLEQVNLRLASSEWLLLCGPSGAGKSSLLRLLAGLDGPGQGRVTRFGRTVSSQTPLRSRFDGRVALLCQNPEHHFIASTVLEDIAWGPIHRGLDAREARDRAAETAKALRIHHLRDRPCHQLSFGEQRRVALAGLLVLEPELLLLDEPTAGLDPVASQELLRLVEASVRRTGATCVWATHDLHVLPPLAARVVLLRDREVVFDGAATEGLSPSWLVRAGLAVDKDEVE